MRIFRGNNSPQFKWIRFAPISIINSSVEGVLRINPVRARYQQSVFGRTKVIPHLSNDYMMICSISGTQS